MHMHAPTLAGDAAIELLVTKPGQYALSVDGTPLALKEAKPPRPATEASAQPVFALGRRFVG
jgi:hypothetical protein